VRKQKKPLLVKLNRFYNNGLLMRFPVWLPLAASSAQWKISASRNPLRAPPTPAVMNMNLPKSLENMQYDKCSRLKKIPRKTKLNLVNTCTE
jgi:hypothetical protein